MKLIFLLTFISCLALSKAKDPYEVGYQLTLGPLEFFLKLEKQQVSNCYKEKKQAYENSLQQFSQRVGQIKHLFETAFPIRQPYRNYMWWGYNEMSLVSNSLYKFFEEFNKKIFDGKSYDGGNVIWYKRPEVEDHYNQYEKHGKSLKDVHTSYHEQIFTCTMDEAFEKIYNKSVETTNEILKCLKNKGVTYT